MGRGFWRFVGGTVVLLAAAYAAAVWLENEGRLRLGLADGPAPEGEGATEGSSLRLLDDLQERLRYAIDEGRQAAAEVRAELEASAKGPRPSSNGSKPPAAGAI